MNAARSAAGRSSAARKTSFARWCSELMTEWLSLQCQCPTRQPPREPPGAAHPGAPGELRPHDGRRGLAPLGFRVQSLNDRTLHRRTDVTDEGRRLPQSPAFASRSMADEQLIQHHADRIEVRLLGEMASM